MLLMFLIARRLSNQQVARIQVASLLRIMARLQAILAVSLQFFLSQLLDDANPRRLTAASCVQLRIPIVTDV